ncbi:MFS transporter [Fangia hongkongensis]|uniref:MFS transporter n=1 Tax=Fangia hongkongensis TaxID=270495 RepID=UPI000380BFD9|nr:MFS transporter [Fangia hongkongensis]MBK2124189.1 MFS transporter [Fangia hongkongensis]
MTSTHPLIRYLIYLLALLSILTVNIYLPAMPILQHLFHAAKSEIALTVGFYMLGLAIGIPLYGALSDHLSLKKVLLTGISLFIVGNIIAIFSHSVSMLIIARLIQGIGAASALSLWQAIAIKYFKETSKHIISSGYMIIGSMPALAPIIGGSVLSLTNWQGIFIFLIILAVIVFVLSKSLNAEPKEKHQTTDHEKSHLFIAILKEYKGALSNPKFVLYALASAMVYSSAYVYFSQVPFLLAKIGYNTQSLSLFFIPISVAFLLGGTFAKFTLRRNIQFKITLSIGVISFALAPILSVFAEAFTLNGFLLMAPFFLLTIGAGILMPTLVGHALSLQHKRAGTAASTIGTLQNIIAFLLSSMGAYLAEYGYHGLVISYFILTLLLIAFVIIAAILPEKGIKPAYCNAP